jgi:hypothetical protein
LTGILFVLKTGIPWEDLPQEMGCGSGMTCWRRLQEWNEAGVWFRMHQVLLARLDNAHLINRTRAAIDSTFARAEGGVERSGKNPTDLAPVLSVRTSIAHPGQHTGRERGRKASVPIGGA